MLRHFPRQFFASAISYGLVSCALGGCSIHPIPKDVTGYDTATIVRKIRCEARDAIRNVVLEILHRGGRHQEVQEITDDFSLRQLSLNSWEQTTLNDVQNIGIVYDFSLQGDETDNLMLNATILEPFKNGMATVAPSFGNKIERNNVRTFTVSDSFASLSKLGKKNRNHCHFGASASSGPNYEYPIAGRIGLDEMVKTFVRLAVSGDLVTGQGITDVTTDDILSPAATPTMVDTLIFTTTVNGGLQPGVTLTPATGVQLSNTSLNASITRMDTHEVVIGMAMGKSTVHLSAAALASSLTPKTTSLFFTSNPKDPGRSGEALAAQAVTQYYIRRDLRRASIAIVP